MPAKVLAGLITDLMKHGYPYVSDISVWINTLYETEELRY